MKKLLGHAIIIAAALSMSACATFSGQDASSINSARSKNAAMMSETQYKQQNRQRTAELEESATKHSKARMNMGTVREGMDTVREGIGLLNYIKGVF